MAPTTEHETLEYAPTDTYDGLAVDFALLGRYLATETGTRLEPDRVVHVAARAIPHASHCAITLTAGSGRPRTMAATGELPLLVDSIQYATRQGPCLDALEKDDVAVVEDMTTDGQWPSFAQRCAEQTPVRSMLSVRLSLENQDRAAMNLYANLPHHFEEIDVGVASMLAPFVALSVQSALHQQRVASLEVALQTSRQIGTAMGILMARELVSSEQAFQLLRRASQHLNRKLRDIAAEVTETGTLPVVTTNIEATKSGAAT